MLTLQQQAHRFAHRMAMCQPLAPKQTATIPKPSFVYLANDEIYPEPQNPLIPTPFEPDMLIVATNFKKFSTALTAKHMTPRSAGGPHIHINGLPRTHSPGPLSSRKTPQARSSPAVKTWPG